MALTAQVLAQIYFGDITRWDDAAILALNPGVPVMHLTAAGIIQPIMRLDDCDENYILKRVFNKVYGGNTTAPLDFTANLGPRANPNVKLIAGGTSVASWVLGHDATLAFVFRHTAKFYTMPQIWLSKEGDPVPFGASSVTLVASALEEGAGMFLDSHFEASRDGDGDHSFMFDISGAPGFHAWPFSTYVYIVLRRETMRSSLTCDDRQELADFMAFLWEDVDFFHWLAFDEHSSVTPLPEVIAHNVFEELNEELYCEGRVLKNPEGNRTSNFYTEGDFVDLLETATIMYNSMLGADAGARLLVHHSDNPLSDAGKDPNGLEVGLGHDPQTQGTVALVTANAVGMAHTLEEMQAGAEGLVAIPMGLVGLGAFYQLCETTALPENCTWNDLQLRMSPSTVGAILRGQVTTWNDPAIANDNPDVDTLPNENIQLFGLDFSAAWTGSLKANFGNDFEFKSGSVIEDTWEHLHAQVAHTPFSFGLVPTIGTLQTTPHATKFAAVYNRARQAVVPSPEALTACGYDTFSPDVPGYFGTNVTWSMDPGCYPLSELLFMLLGTEFESDNVQKSCVDAGVEFAVDHVRWLAGVSDHAALNPNETHEEREASLGGGLGACKAYWITEEEQSASELFSSWGVGPLLDSHPDMKKRNLEELERITCDGKSVVAHHRDLNFLGQGVYVTAWILTGLSWLFIFSAIAWVWRNWRRRIIFNSSPRLLLVLLMGAAIGVAVLPLFALEERNIDLHDPVAPNKDNLDAACQAQPYFICAGMSLMFLALILKSRRLVLIFNNPKLKRVFISDSRIETQIYLFVALQLVLVTLPTFIGDPFHWERVTLAWDPVSKDPTSSVGVCSIGTTGAVALLVPQGTIFLVLLALALYFSWASRTVPWGFGEGKWIAIAVVLIVEAVAFSIPVLMLSYFQPGVNFFIKTVLILVIFMGTVAAIFIPKLILVYYTGADGAWRTGQSSNSNSQSRSRNKYTGGENSATRHTHSRGAVVSDQHVGAASDPHLASKESVISWMPGVDSMNAIMPNTGPDLNKSSSKMKKGASYRGAGASTGSLDYLGHIKLASKGSRLAMGGNTLRTDPATGLVMTARAARADSDVSSLDSKHCKNELFAQVNEIMENDDRYARLLVYASRRHADEGVRFMKAVRCARLCSLSCSMCAFRC